MRIPTARRLRRRAVLVLGAALAVTIASVFLPFDGVARGATTTGGTACPTAGVGGSPGVVTGSTGGAVHSQEQANTASSPLVPADGPTDGLAFTGFDSTAALVAAVFLIGAGVLLVMGARRRRQRVGGRGEPLACAVVALTLIAQATPGPNPGSAACAPAAVLPESPLGILLPVAGMAVFAGAYVYRRRRAPTAADGG